MIKTLINKKNIVAVFVLLSNFVFSQGLIEVPLHGNQVLIDKWEDVKNSKAYFFTPSIGDTIGIPLNGLLDDFSYQSPFPDTLLWMNCNVFVNRNYPVAPPTIGVATFDGINKYGYPYDFLVGQTSSLPADTLTSKRIRLDTIHPAITDSIYLSFYYQPQGRGNSPEPHDSLVLEFKEKRLDSIFLHTPIDTIYSTEEIPDTTAGSTLILTIVHDSTVYNDSTYYFLKEVWRHIWSHKGEQTPADSSWKLVMIPITDTAFLKPGFQFRFYNYATISGNGDQWSIDNVYLGYNQRNWDDTIINENALVYDPPSMIKPYSSMPWRHYNPTFMKDSIIVLIRNNNNAQKGLDYSHNIYDYNHVLVNNFIGNDPINPYSIVGYYRYRVTPLYSIPLLSGPGNYSFEAIISTTPDFNRRNDTVEHFQTFSNYFAYDDGTAESAFAMNATQIGEIAEQFTTTVPDTLRALDIYFNPLWHDASLYEGSMNIKVWADAGGYPGALIFSDTARTPWYNQQEYAPDHFKRYFITPQYITPQTIYVGFLQNTSQELSVGVDKNTNSQYKIFYTTTGTWFNSPYPGSLMIRPVFGTYNECTGVNSPPSSSTSFTVYPNPASTQLYLNYTSTSSNNKISYSVIDVYGRIVLENKLPTSNQQSTINSQQLVDISVLSEGIYFVRLNDGSTISTTKFIKKK